MGRGLTKPPESSEAVGHGSEGDRKEGSNGAVPGRNVQDGDVVGDIIWQKDLGGYRGDSRGPGGVPPPGGMTDHEDDGKKRGRRRVGVPIGCGGNGIRWDPLHWSVHQEAEYYHRGEGDLPPRV